MTKFFILLTVLFSIGANATETVVFESVPYSNRYYKIDTNYEVNPSMGRAWLEIEFQRLRDSDRDKTVRVKVPGMSFDQNTKDIVYNGVVCGTRYYKGGLFGGFYKIRETGNCQIKVIKDRTMYDDGFNTRNVRRLRVTIATR